MIFISNYYIRTTSIVILFLYLHAHIFHMTTLSVKDIQDDKDRECMILGIQPETIHQYSSLAHRFEICVSQLDLEIIYTQEAERILKELKRHLIREKLKNKVTDDTTKISVVDPTTQQLQVELTLINSELVGPQKLYSVGKLCAVFNLPDVYTFYYSSGHVSAIWNFQSLGRSVLTVYYKKGTVAKRMEFQDKKLHGISQGYNLDEKIIFESHYLHGKKEGQQKVWYQNGTQLRLTMDWNNDLKHGEAHEWHENGQLSAHDYWQNGKGEGLSQHWYPNGQLKSSCIYHNEKIEGLLQGWHPNGKPLQESTYVDGLVHGTQTEWYENGQMKCTVQVVCGQPTTSSVKAWKPNGQPIYIPSNAKTTFKIQM